MKKTGVRKSSTLRSSLAVPLSYLILAILNYGLLMHKLGFYWDDFPYLYLNHSQGISGYPAYMAGDRPFSAWFFMLEGFLFGENPLGYHFFALILRWAGACMFYLVLEKIFTENRNLNFISAALFLVYPAFLQQHISLIYSLHFAVLFFFFLSVFFMLLSLENHSHYLLFTILGLLTSLSIFSSEYFAFLEFVRPVFIQLFYEKQKPAVFIPKKKTLQIWFPFLISFLVFFTWRIFIFKFPTYSPKLIDIFKQNIFSGFGYFLSRLANDFFTVAFKSWLPIFQDPLKAFSNPQLIIVWFLVSSVSILVVIHITHKKLPQQTNKNTTTNLRYIYLGLFFISLAGIPIWITDLPIKLEFAWDRLALPFSPGVSLFITGLFSEIFNKSSLRNIALGLLIGLSSGYQYLNSYEYLQEWISLNNFFYQLTWRAPGLTPGTTLLTDQFILKYYSDNSLTAPLNWIYDSNNHTLNLNYMFYFLDVRLGRRLPGLGKGLEINQPYRSFSFQGSTDQILFLRYNPPSCMHVLDNSTRTVPDKTTPNLSKAINLSNPSLIQPQPSFHFPDFFLDENKQDWCYFFEKAELARQQSDWKKIIQLANEAFNNHFQPYDPVELLPFIEAYGHESDFTSALQLSKSALQTSNELKIQICGIWNEFIKEIPFEKIDEPVTQFFYSELKCMQ